MLVGSRVSEGSKQRAADDAVPAMAAWRAQRVGINNPFRITLGRSLFQLYDRSWLAPGTSTKKESLEYAYRTGVVCADEILLHPNPYPDRESWCDARLKESERRLSALGSDMKTVLVSHWPLIRQPTDALRFPEFAQWCGTSRTADWHTRFRAEVAVYGHLHIPRTSHYDGVRFEEVSLGYPSEWSKRPRPPEAPKKVLPA